MDLVKIEKICKKVPREKILTGLIKLLQDTRNTNAWWGLESRAVKAGLESPPNGVSPTQIVVFQEFIQFFGIGAYEVTLLNEISGLVRLSGQTTPLSGYLKKSGVPLYNMGKLTPVASDMIKALSHSLTYTGQYEADAVMNCLGFNKGNMNFYDSKKRKVLKEFEKDFYNFRGSGNYTPGKIVFASKA